MLSGVLTDTLNRAFCPGSIEVSVTIPDLYWKEEPAIKEESAAIRYEKDYSSLKSKYLVSL